MLWKEWMSAGLFSQSCVCRLLICNVGKSLGTGLFFFVLNLRLSCFTFLFCHLFSVSWFAFHSASVHCIPGWFSFSCKLLQMHSPGLWLGCEMGSPALAPRFPCCILTPPCAVNHRESWKTFFSFFLRKKKVVCVGHLILYLISELGQLTVQLHVYWVLQEWLLARQSWTAPPVAASPWRSLGQTDAAPWVAGRARGPALSGQPQQESQALVSLGFCLCVRPACCGL